VEQIGAGFSLERRDFTPSTLRGLARQFTQNPSFSENAWNAGEKLAELGGIPRIVEVLEE
jgi:hypothetical protein